MSFPEDDFPEGRGSLPEDVASAARSCQAILIIALIIALLLCVAYAIYKLT